MSNNNVQKSIMKSINKVSYPKTAYISIIFRNNKSIVIDSLKKSINKEMDTINGLQEKNKRDIEWENELEM